MYVCMYVCMNACMHACMYVYSKIYTINPFVSLVKKQHREIGATTLSAWLLDFTPPLWEEGRSSDTFFFGRAYSDTNKVCRRLSRTTGLDVRPIAWLLYVDACQKVRQELDIHKLVGAAFYKLWLVQRCILGSCEQGGFQNNLAVSNQIAVDPEI